jgi:hypothetical protein
MKRKKIVQNIIGVILILVFFFIINNERVQKWFGNNACTSIKDSVSVLDLEGLVLTKYLDVKSHMHETISIENNGVNLKIIIPNEYSGLYQFIQVGDSIFKEKNSLFCNVKRTGNTKVFFIDFKCH